MRPFLLCSIFVLLRVPNTWASEESQILTQQVIFYEVIKYSPSLTYLHVAVPINLNSFKQEKEVFKSFLTQMSQNESEATQNDTKTISNSDWTNNFHEMAIATEMMLGSVKKFEIIYDNQMQFLQNHLISSYFKLQKSSELGLLKSKIKNLEAHVSTESQEFLQGTNLGYYPEFDLENLKQQLDARDKKSENLIFANVEEERQMELLRELAKLKDDFKNLPTLGWRHFLSKVEELVMSIEEQFKQNLFIFNSFILRDFSPDNFGTRFLASVSKIAKKKSKKYGHEFESELHNAEISHLLCKDNQLMIIFHIPTVVQKDQVKIYRAVPISTPAPFHHQLSKGPNSFMTVQLDHDLFAVSSDSKRHVVISDSVVICRKVFNQEFCKGVPYLNAEPNRTCLSALFYGQSASARELCSFGMGTDVDVHSYQLTQTDYFFMSQNLIQAPIHCSFDQRLEFPMVIINQTTHVSIPQGCGIELPTRSIWSSSNFKNLPYKVSSVQINLNSFLAKDFLSAVFEWMDQNMKMLILNVIKIFFSISYTSLLVGLCFDHSRYQKLIPYVLFITHNAFK